MHFSFAHTHTHSHYIFSLTNGARHFDDTTYRIFVFTIVSRLFLLLLFLLLKRARTRYLFLLVHYKCEQKHNSTLTVTCFFAIRRIIL